MTYAIYTKTSIPIAMIARYPAPAKYLVGTEQELTLFCETLDAVTGVTHENIHDIASLGFDLTGESGLAPDRLVEQVGRMMAEDHSGKEIQLSKAQGRWLHSNHPAFMPAGE